MLFTSIEIIEKKKLDNNSNHFQAILKTLF